MGKESRRYKARRDWNLFVMEKGIFVPWKIKRKNYIKAFNLAFQMGIVEAFTQMEEEKREKSRSYKKEYKK